MINQQQYSSKTTEDNQIMIGSKASKIFLHLNEGNGRSVFINKNNQLVKSNNLLSNGGLIVSLSINIFNLIRSSKLSRKINKLYNN